MIPVSGQPNGQGGPLSPTSGAAGGVGGPAASPPGGTPKSMRRMRPPSTFAGMQQQGVARPSPELVQAQQNANQLTALNQSMQQQASPYQPSVQSAMQAAQRTVDNASAGRDLGMFQYGGMVDALGVPMMQQVMTLLNDPTQGLNEAAQSNFDRNNRVIGREFGTLREGLNENMAARGLDASTIAATKLGDLGARQAEAQADLAARVQEKLINDRASAMNNALNAALGLRGQEIEKEKDLFTVNRDTGEMGWRRAFDTKKMEMEGSQFDRRLGLDAELGRGNLGLAQQRLGFDMNRDSRDFAYGQTRDAANDAFRNRDFDFRERTDARDFGYRQSRDTIGDQQWNKQFDYNQNRDNRNFDYQKSRDAVGDTQWNRQFDRAGQWRADDNKYRDDRDKVNDGRYTDQWNRDESRYQTGQDQWKQQFDFTKDNARTGNIMSLLQGMGFNSLPPGALASIFKTLGIDPPPGITNNGGYGGGGYGGGGGGGYSNTGTFY